MHKQRRSTSTPLMVLALIERTGRPMSTYEMGLHVCDDRPIPRPLSKIVRSLARDGYLESHAKQGRRTSLWTITEQGLNSLSKRSAEASKAFENLDPVKCMTAEEIAVIGLLNDGPSNLSALCDSAGISPGKARTALKRLVMRGNVRHNEDGTYQIVS